MPALAAPRARTAKPRRTMHFNKLCGVLFLHVHRSGEREVGYYVDPLPSDWPGRAFTLTKIADKSIFYDVHVGPVGKSCSCECKGFLRWGHCKHVDALRLLLTRGDL